MAKVFADFDVAGFWKPSEYALKEYVGAPLTDAAVAAVERELGYKLPASYVEFMRFQNGGIPRRYVAQDFLGRTAIRTGRHLASSVHVDSLYEEWTFAVDVLTAGGHNVREPSEDAAWGLPQGPGEGNDAESSILVQ